MSLQSRAIADIQRITTGQAGVPLRFVSRLNPSVTATILGIHTRHHLSVTSDGNVTNDMNAHCGFSEALLVATGYPVRNANNQVIITGDILYAFDSQGIERKYVIKPTNPDETFGYIRCTLESCL